MLQDLLFFAFASILLVGALGVITAKNPMHCILFLVLTFFNAAALFILIGAEFLGLLLIMVYVGAVAVMFLFVLMTIEFDFSLTREGFAAYLPVGILIALVVLLELIIAVWGGLFTGGKVAIATLPPAAGVQNIKALGQVLFTNYVLPFQAAGLILLIAMVGAIVLAHRTRDGVRRQRIVNQVKRKRGDSITLTQPPIGQGVTTSYFVKEEQE